MIKGTVVKADTIKLVLSGTDNIDNELLKALNGGKARVITDPIKLPDGDITTGIIIEMERDKTNKEPES